MRSLIKLLNKILFRIRKKQESTQVLKKILVVSNTALGDTILSTPVIKTLRKNFPNIYIAFMVNKDVYPLFANYEYANKIVSYDKSFIGIIKHALFIKKEKFNSIFLLHSNGPQDIFMSLLSGVNEINKAINLSSDITPYNKINYSNCMEEKTKKIISNNIKYTTYQHIIEHRLNILEKYNPTKIYKTLELPGKYYNDFCNDKYNNLNNTITISIQLGASHSYRMWPLEKCSQLINKLLSKYPYLSIVLTGSLSENLLAKKLTKSIIYPERILNFCGKTTDRKSTRLNSSHTDISRMPSSA